MSNPYHGWKLANDALQDINTTCKAVSEVLITLPINTAHKLVIQEFILVIAKRINDYQKESLPLLENAAQQIKEKNDE